MTGLSTRVSSGRMTLFFLRTQQFGADFGEAGAWGASKRTAELARLGLEGCDDRLVRMLHLDESFLVFVLRPPVLRSLSIRISIKSNR